MSHFGWTTKPSTIQLLGFGRPAVLAEGNYDAMIRQRMMSRAASQPLNAP